MYRHIAALAFVLLVSCVSSAAVPADSLPHHSLRLLLTGNSAKRGPTIEIVDNRHTENDFHSLSLPVETNKLFECPSGWKFFCFHNEESNESHCECYEMINFAKDCPANTNKYCSDYIKTECSCSYAKQPDCQPIFDFTCAASTSSSSTWTCTCAGKVWGKKSGCPSGFNSHCSSKGCACKKVTKFLSDYTPKPKSLATSKSLSTVEIEIEDQISGMSSYKITTLFEKPLIIGQILLPPS